ncbi:unnamed protein product [Acanthoscelides obtectus]|uniref:CCHC-type domain-containing protein n=1 Tax=Acanthoscelides obtectus TaxID=200917 RepID=A0A9P0MBC6_ACAOB|nr:unnamed protein product [Acanthoscelides obtectus]CAK1686013.1 Gag-Pol polyprotein [Acanthoscelides obtectus]
MTLHIGDEDKRASEIKSCFRCGSKGHISSNCPAREKICKKCGYKGHVSKQCRTKPGKRTHYESTTVKKSRYREPDKDDDDHNTNYVFHIDNDSDISCMIGGIPVQMVIDSGSKCNILNDETWTYLKNSQVSVSNQIKRPKKILMAHASKEPLTILGCYDAEIKDEPKCSFNLLKECLCKIKSLGYYDPKDRTQVIADASPVGLEAVLI